MVIGGGAAGFFAAIHAAENNPKARVTILERAGEVLGKVKISGGGRCNVCNAERDPRQLVKFYPRGAKALLGPFHRFCTAETIEFFESRGVPLKVEPDGRVFPISDQSQSIVDCLVKAAIALGVVIKTKVNVLGIGLGDGKWRIEAGEFSRTADKLVIAPGSSPRIWEMLAALGHRIEPPVPSLFTFNVRDDRIEGLQGLAVNAEVGVAGEKLQAQGPVLITHWGMSGPAILRLSAWGARSLCAVGYVFELLVNWTGGKKLEQVMASLAETKKTQPKRLVCSDALHGIPSRLWKKLCDAAEISDQLRWADLSNANAKLLAMQLVESKFKVQGKSTNKDEFVTCGGVALDEVNFKTMESKILPGLYFAGEVLDIDAITGGYNFQAAWTTGAIAGVEVVNG